MMPWSRRLEAISGVAAGVLGLAALGVALFAPLGMRSGCSATLSSDGVTQTDCSTATPVSLAQAQGMTSLIPLIALFGALFIAIAVIAVLHSAGHGNLIPLWICTGLLWGAMMLALLSIGIFFAPSAVLALLAAIAGSLSARRTTPTFI